MTVISEAFLEKRIYELIRDLGAHLREDVLEGMRQAREMERAPRAQNTLDLIIKNAEMARELDMPLCQDTGTAWILLELPEGVCLEGDLQAAANRAVARGYQDAGLRMSLVHDALTDRSNTGDNTPAFLEIALSKNETSAIHIMLKGAGSDNASRLHMLTPDEGWEGIKKQVIAQLHEKAAMACPPLIIGLGVGATYDKVAGLSKRALLRDIRVPNPDQKLDALERELLAEINRSGIGPAGLGGDTTALRVLIESAPCHIAALPLSINLMCSAMRSVSAPIF